MSSENPLPPLPDHLSTDPHSPHHDAAVFQRDIGIRFNGKQRHDVAEYCVSEGWIKLPSGPPPTITTSQSMASRGPNLSSKSSLAVTARASVVGQDQVTAAENM